MDSFDGKRKLIFGAMVFMSAIIVCLIYYNYRVSTYVTTIGEFKNREEVETKIKKSQNNQISAMEAKSQIKKETEKVTEKATQEQNKIININKATIEELMTLPEIGEVTAQNIIKYREENGRFKSKEEIKNVSRIGEKIYGEIEFLIIVG